MLTMYYKGVMCEFEAELTHLGSPILYHYSDEKLAGTSCSK